MVKNNGFSVLKMTAQITQTDFFLNLIPQTCKGAEKFAKNLPKSPTQTKPADFDSLLNISRPHYAFEG